jgi:YVTN family beta-propeller protein
MREYDQPKSRRDNPFQGPRAFTRYDKDWFFGRDDETDELLSLILAHKAVLVYAQSGAGKTSLLNAKIIPELEKNGLYVLPIARVKGYQEIKKISESHEDLKNEAKAVGTQSSSSEKLMHNPFMYNAIQCIIAGDTSNEFDNLSKLSKITTFCEFLQKKIALVENKAKKKKPTVIIFDQLEELFRSSPDGSRENQEYFFSQIANALDKENLPLRVVLVIREDYLASLDPFGLILPEKLRPRFRLEPLDKDHAKEAIQMPLEKSKEYFKEISNYIDELLKRRYEDSIDKEAGSGKKSIGVVEKIVRSLCTMRFELADGQPTEVIGEFVEPIYLQIVGQSLWEKLVSASRQGKTDINLDYLEVGDVDKALGDFYVDIVKQAAIQSKVSEDEIRDWCEKNLITYSGTRSIIHKGLDRTGGLDNKVLDVLEDKYLVRREMRAGAPWYELTHDRLIRPIRNSNQKWQHDKEEKSAIRYQKIAYLTIILAVGVVASIVGLWYYMSHIPSNISSSVCKNSTIVGSSPINVNFNPQTNITYVANKGSDTVSVIDAVQDCKTNAVIHVGKDPVDVAFNPNTNTVYVANSGSNTVSVINGKNNTVVRNITVGKVPAYIAVDNKANTVYVANKGSDTVSVINGTTNIVMKTVPVGDNPVELAVNSKTDTAYVANSGSNTISIIYENGTVRPIPVENSAAAISVDPITDKVYMANFESNTISVMNDKNNIVTVPVGDTPVAIVVNPYKNKIYVSNFDSRFLSVIDGNNSKVIEDVPIDKSPRNIAINPYTQELYIPNIDNKTLSVINPTQYPVFISPTEKNPTYVAVEKNPTYVAVDNKTNTVYVANSDSNSVSIINGVTNTVVKNVPVGGHPAYIAVNPNTTTAYIANSGNKSVSVINGKTNTVVRTIPVRKDPGHLAVDLNTNTVYVANSGNKSVSVINGKTNTVVNTVPVGEDPTYVAVNPNTDTVYVVNRDSSTVSVIDGKTNVVQRPVAVDYNPAYVAVDKNIDTVYVANKGFDTVSVINGKTNTIVQTIPVGSMPIDLAVNPNTDTVYVVNKASNSVSVINGKNNTVIQTIAVGNDPDSISVNPNTDTVYVVNKGSNNVSVINGKNNTVIQTIAVGNDPDEVAINQLTNRWYVSNSGDASVSIIGG